MNVQKMTHWKVGKSALTLDCCRHELTAQVFNVGGGIGLELSMRLTIVVTTALLLVLGIGIAGLAGYTWRRKRAAE